MAEREAIDRGWFYVLEPSAGEHVPSGRLILADDGQPLSRRVHGAVGRILVRDLSGAHLPAATLLRAAAALGEALESRGEPNTRAQITLGPSGTAPVCTRSPGGQLQLTLSGPSVASAPVHHPVHAQIAELVSGAGHAPDPIDPIGALPSRPTSRALFFESLMNTDMPHNDREISQGVLHMISPLRELGTEVVLVNAKMPITGDDRPVHGLEHLEAALQGGPIGLVCITLLEGYWHGVLKLIATLRGLGCRARIAVGGVMPTLAPEHVAAHLPDVSFVCRGAGEVILPQLVQILGDTSVDEPLSPAQQQALLNLRGVLTLDAPQTSAGQGLTLLSARADHTVTVTDLDRVTLDLSYVQPRHVEGGIELATSRGCIHRCTFCSILGRESYQARSAGSIVDVLHAYEHRFHEMFGSNIPPSAWRVHISDDDFACERQRTIDFFRALPHTRFRLSSIQVAIGDLCRRVDGKLLTEPDHELLDAMQPTCFADHGRPIPRVDYFEDHKSRTWSSFLQIGVETYSDREIARLGKGYKLAHVRTIVAELARRDLHMDGYFILSNAETTAEDLVDVFSEVARLKLRFPEHFHMRFPVVPRLVSYFTAASHRRHVRRGRREVMTLRDHASVPGHPELDYPFVEHDVSADPWVDRTVSADFVTDDDLYTGNLDRLAQLWRTWLQEDPTSPDAPRLRALVRRLDDLPRRLVFDAWAHGRQGALADWPGPPPSREVVQETAERVLGPPATWARALHHALREGPTRHLHASLATPANPLAEHLAAASRPELSLRLHGTAPATPHLRALASHVRKPLRLRVDLAAADALSLPPGTPLFLSLHPDAAGLPPGPGPEALAEIAEAARSQGLRFAAWLPLTAAGLAELPSRLATAHRLGATHVELHPRGAGWSTAALQRLARTLPGQPIPIHLAPDADLAPWVDAEGAIHILPAEPGTRTVARLSSLTNPCRHVYDAARARDPAAAKGVAAARKLVAGFAAHQRGREDAGARTLSV